MLWPNLQCKRVCDFEYAHQPGVWGGIGRAWGIFHFIRLDIGRAILNCICTCGTLAGFINNSLWIRGRYREDWRCGRGKRQLYWGDTERMQRSRERASQPCSLNQNAWIMERDYSETALMWALLFYICKYLIMGGVEMMLAVLPVRIVGKL